MKNKTIKSQHTQGPWYLGHRPEPRHDGDRVITSRALLSRNICFMDGGPNDDTTVLANARLIAAAPSLLEAVKQMRDMLLDYDEDMSEVDALIAKAEGR